MINLHSKNNSVLGVIHHEQPFIAKITTNSVLPKALRAKHVLLVSGSEQQIPDGFGLVLVAHDNDQPTFAEKSWKRSSWAE